MKATWSGVVTVKQKILIKYIQACRKVGRMRVLQWLMNYESPRSNPVIYTTQFMCNIDKEIKNKLNPCSIEKSFTQAIGNKSVSTRSKTDSELVIEISHESKSYILPTTTKVNFPQYQQRVAIWESASNRIHRYKGMNYIQEYDTTDFIEYSRQLKKEFNLLDVKNAVLTKSKNLTSTPLFLTFKEKITTETPRHTRRTSKN